MSEDRGPLAGIAGLSLIVLSGEFARVHFALAMAAAAAAIDRPAILFFTNHALYALAGGDAAGYSHDATPPAMTATNCFSSTVMNSVYIEVGVNRPTICPKSRKST